METLIVRLENKKQLAAMKKFLKAFNIAFEEEQSSYNPEFVARIKQGRADLKAGKGVRVDIHNL